MAAREGVTAAERRAKTKPHAREHRCSRCGAAFTGRKRASCSRACADAIHDTRKVQRNQPWRIGPRLPSNVVLIETMGRGRCRACGQWLPAEAFGARRRSECKGCRDYAAEAEVRKPQLPDEARRRRDRAIERMQAEGRASCDVLDRPVSRAKAAAAGRRAWCEWMTERAPDAWLDAYWAAHPMPWLDPRLSDAEKYATRYRFDHAFVVAERMRSRMKKKVRGGRLGELMRGAINRAGRSRQVEVTCGFTIAELVAHLERQFVGEMSWERFKAGEIHIDHVLPVSSFDLEDDTDFAACWSLPNLRPLWAHENIAKSSRVETLL